MVASEYQIYKREGGLVTTVRIFFNVMYLCYFLIVQNLF